MTKPSISNHVIILVLLVVALVIQNIFLSKQNTDMINVNYKLLREHNARSIMARGDTVGNFYAYDDDSTKVYIDLANQNTLLMVYSSRCSACNENKKYWDEIVAQCDTSMLKVVFLGMDSPKELRHYSPISSEAGKKVSIYLDTALIQKYKLNQTPQTILVGNDQRVVKSIAGVLTSNDVNQLISQSRRVQRN